jgi:LAO/AO transport system kinase
MDTSIPTDLWSRFQRHDRQALARLLSFVSRGQALADIRTRLAARGVSKGHPLTPSPSPPRGEGNRSRVIAFTGAGGVGKSTLVGKMIEAFRAVGHTVAVLACDPESPLTGGALLGDRLRMPQRPEDDGVFVRSVAAVSGHEAVAEHLDLMIDLLEAFGFDLILVETVGAGQGDTAARFLADVMVVMVQPEAGDDIQWEKAGQFEVADVVVVHKADLPGADRTEAQVKSLLNLPGCRDVPVLRVSSAKNQGLNELRDRLLSLPTRRGREPKTLAQLNRLILEQLEEHQRANPAEWRQLLEAWQAGTKSVFAILNEARRLVR